MPGHGPKTSAPETPVLPLPCACANLRRAARVVSQFYDQKLRETGMRVTQFTLLQALARAGSISQGKLGDLLGMDSTTLTRTLGPLRRKNWVQAEPGEDRRQLRLKLTAIGQREYRRAIPYWLSAQRQLRRALGKNGWNEILQATVRTVTLTPRP